MNTYSINKKIMSIYLTRVGEKSLWMKALGITAAAESGQGQTDPGALLKLKELTTNPLPEPIALVISPIVFQTLQKEHQSLVNGQAENGKLFDIKKPGDLAIAIYLLMRDLGIMQNKIACDFILSEIKLAIEEQFNIQEYSNYLRILFQELLKAREYIQFAQNATSSSSPHPQ